jgi:spermidine synthase
MSKPGGFKMNIRSKQHLQLPFLLLIFFSGVSCLIYELLWSRYLNLIFGASVFAVATVLACFMFGLAVGSWRLGKKIDRNSNSIRTLCWLQLGIGLYGLLSPLIYQAISHLVVFIFQSFNPNAYLKQGIRIIISMFTLILPTYLMGGTFPAFIKIYTKQIAGLGKDVGLVYAVNTLGGAIGAFFTGFLLIKFFGLSNTFYLASAINILCAGMIGLFLAKIHADPVQEKVKLKNSSSIQGPGCSKTLLYLTLALFGLSGFTSLAYEVYWTKILTFFFKDSSYDLAIVLTTFLLGIVIGSFICSKLITKSRKPALLFAVVEILIGLFSILGLFMISQFPYLINHLQTNTKLYALFGERYWFMGTIIRFGYAALIMIIPASLFGATFPLVSRICISDLKRVGRDLGLMNFINTIGATIGSLMAGFCLISWFGIQKSIILLAFLNIGIGVVLIAVIPMTTKKQRFYFLTTTLVTVVLMMVFLPGWDKLRMSTSFLEPDQPLEKILKLHFYKEDVYGLTSVVEIMPLHQKLLITNRLYGQNSSDMLGLEDHRRLGHIPLLLHPEPQSALVIGLGAGISLRGVNEQAIKEIDCVELSGGVIQAAHYFSSENSRITENPDINFIIDDGRSYIGASAKKYDVIIGDILFPMSSGSSNIFSREYFALCKNRLQTDGLFCQWLPIHQLSLQDLKIIIKTFKTVFPNTSLWYGMIGESVPVVGCIGTEKRLEINFAWLQTKYRNRSLVKKLAEINLGNPYLLLSHFIMEGDSINNFCVGEIINTDDRPIIEFLTPKLFIESRVQGVKNLSELSPLSEDIFGLLINTGNSSTAVSLIKRDLNRYVVAKKIIIEGLELSIWGNLDGQAELYQQALERDPGNEDLNYQIGLNQGLLNIQNQFD